MLLLVFLALWWRTDGFACHGRCRSSSWLSPSRCMATTDEAQQRRDVLRDALLTAVDGFPSVATATPSPPPMSPVSFPDDIVPIIQLIDALVALNPTATPTAGWMTCNAPGLLDGVWMLRFTTSAVAPPGRRGPPTITQMVNMTVGRITDVVEFKQHAGKVKGYRVAYEGPAVSATGLDLACTRLVVDRRSRWKLASVRVPFAGFVVPRFFRRDVARPTADARFPNLRAASAAVEIVYLDDEVKIHVTGDGNYHVHSRLYDVWDPMKGWTMVSAV